jgi:MFS family permease
VSPRVRDGALPARVTALPSHGRSLVARTFRSLRVRNYRLYFIGQIVSTTGTWMQSTAQIALVTFFLHGSSVDLGITVALQFTPVLLFGAWGGLLADRFDKHRLLIITQSLFAVQAVVMGALTLTGVVQLWMVWVLAFVMGLINVADNPTRQSFVIEMVGADDLANAVGLNSVVVNASRVAGPAVAGLLIVSVGYSAAFLVNAASFGAVIAALLMMHRGDLHRGRPVPRARGQLRAGLRYAWSQPDLRIPLLAMAIIGTFGYNWSVLLPLMAKNVFHHGAATYTTFAAVMGIGALFGALFAASRGRPSRRILVVSALGFGVFTLLVALAPSLHLEFAALLPMGAAAILYVAMTNSLIQLASTPSMRGRVMALWAIVFLGSTPVGGLFAGFFAAQLGARAALAAGGIINIAGGLWAWYAFRKVRRLRGPASAQPPHTASPELVGGTGPTARQSVEALAARAHESGRRASAERPATHDGGPV